MRFQPLYRVPKLAACLVVASTALLAAGGFAGSHVGAGSGSSSVPTTDGSGAGGEEFVEFREAEPGSGEGMTLGLIALDDAIPFSKLVSDSVREQAEIAGAELVFCDSKLDAAVALECARTFATQGVQGYLNFQPVADAAQSICDAGPQDVPVIAIDIAQGDCQTAFMGANNSRAGNVAGEGLGNYMSENFDCEYDAYISLEDLGVGEVNDLRMNGIRDGFESVCGEIHDERVLDAGRQDIALTKFGDTLTAVPDAERIIVVGINDDSVLGALAAARTAGRQDQLYITGMGSDSTAHCEIATNPNWAGDAAFFPERYGEIGIPYLIDAVNGEEIPEMLLVDHVFVNSDNVGDFYDVSGC
jgi:ribose transport system substrate-binding protein